MPAPLSPGVPPQLLNFIEDPPSTPPQIRRGRVGSAHTSTPQRAPAPARMSAAELSVAVLAVRASVIQDAVEAVTPAGRLDSAVLGALGGPQAPASAVELGGKIQDAAEALTPAGRLDSERLDSADLDAADLDSLESRTVRALPGRLSALSVPQRFPMKIHFVWGFCMGAQGA
jgi:hypothetical protein